MGVRQISALPSDSLKGEPLPTIASESGSSFRRLGGSESKLQNGNLSYTRKISNKLNRRTCPHFLLSEKITCVILFYLVTPYYLCYLNDKYGNFCHDKQKTNTRA